MIIDSSALLAILFCELEEPAFKNAILRADRASISAANLLEASMLAFNRLGAAGDADLDALVDALGLAVVPVTAQHVRIARECFQKFGKGHHPARLNFGDCFAYALAKSTGEPLLYKGDDFSQTDIQAAVGT